MPVFSLLTQLSYRLSGWMVIAFAVAAYFLIKYIKIWLRMNRLKNWAERIGMTYRPGKHRDFIDRYSFEFLPRYSYKGYAFNLMDGQLDGRDIVIFDYIYKNDHQFKHSSNYDRSAMHFSGVICHTDYDFKPLFIRPEINHPFAGFIENLFEGEVNERDIQFDSAAFNRRFHVTSDDPAWAIRIFSKEVMDWLLAHEDYLIEFRENQILMTSERGTYDMDKFERVVTILNGLMDRLEKELKAEETRTTN